jgi:tellurite resistance protein
MPPMRRTDAERLLGALLGNGTGVRPARRRRAAPRSLAGIPGGSALARTAISVLGGIAIEVIRGMNQSRTPAPAQPGPAPAGKTATPRRMPSIDTRGTPWQGGAPSQGSAPSPATQAAAEPDAEAEEALLLVRAMIAAARADGTIDADERRAIAERIDAAGLDAAGRDLVLAEFANPIGLEALARAVPDPVAAAQVYAASVIAVGEASAAERAYLARLAAALRLSPETARAIEERLSA